jgi:hypothetical protein
VGGYATPILVYLQLEPSPKHVQRSDINERAPSDTTGRLAAFPPVKPKDVVVEAENRRWRIENVSSTQKLRATLHQELRLHELPRDDINFKLPVNLSLFDTEFSPEREFTRPMSLGNDTVRAIPDLVPL